MRLYFTSIDRPKFAAKTIVKLSHNISLSVAQNALAGAIGYRNWHDLKANYAKNNPAPIESQANIISTIAKKLADDLDLFIGDAAWLIMKSHVTGDVEFDKSDIHNIGLIISALTDRDPSRKGEPNRLRGFLPFPASAAQFVRNALESRESAANVLGTMTGFAIDLSDPAYLGYTFNDILLSTYQVIPETETAYSGIPDFRLYPSIVVQNLHKEYHWDFANPTVCQRSSSPSRPKATLSSRSKLDFPKTPLKSRSIIRAEIHSDDYTMALKFDATPFFEHASTKDIAELAACDWGGDYPADLVARETSEYPGYERLNHLFDWLEDHPWRHSNRQIGFEVHVCAADAMEFLATHNPQLFRDLVGNNPSLRDLPLPAEGSLPWDQDSQYEIGYLTSNKPATPTVANCQAIVTPSSAFEISDIDVQDAFKRLGKTLSLDEADTMLPKFDRIRTQKAALYGEDLDEQAEFAIQEIMTQIRELGLI